MGEFRQIDYFLVNEERKEVIQVNGPGETQPPREWKGTSYEVKNTWNGIDEMADIIADYKWIPYRKYKAGIKGHKLNKQLHRGNK